MAQPSKGLQRLHLPVVVTARPLQVQIVKEKKRAEKRLRIRCLGGSFPEEGEAFLRLSDRAETSHWYAPAKVQGDLLTADLTGIGELYNPEQNAPLFLTLARKQGDGLALYPLRGRRFRARLRAKKCPYLNDNRVLWGAPVAEFTRDGGDYEVLPRFTLEGRKAVMLALNFCPRSLRYWSQLRCGIRNVALEEDHLSLTVVGPEGAPELLALAIHQSGGQEQGCRRFPVEPEGGGYSARIPLSALPMEDGTFWNISAVCSEEDGVDRYVPLSILDAEVHQRMGELANGQALRREGEIGCYLMMNKVCSLILCVSQHPPFVQEGIAAGTLEAALEQELLLPLGHLYLQDLGGEGWNWRFRLPNVSLSGGELLLLATKKGSRLSFPVKVLSCDQAGSVLEADLSSVVDQVENTQIVQWRLSLARRQGGQFWYVGLRMAERTVRTLLNTDEKWQDILFSYGEPIGEAPLQEQTLQGVICCPQNGNCTLQLHNRLRRYERQIICRAEKSILRGKTLHLRVQCPDAVPGTWESFALMYRYKQESDRKVFFLPKCKTVQKQGYTLMTASIDLGQFTFSPLYWDIRAVFRGEDGVPYVVRIRPQLAKDKYWCKQKSSSLYRVEDKLRKKLNRLGAQLERFFFSSSYRQDQEMSVSLYKTLDNCYALVCQAYSPYSGFLFRCKERFALIWSVLMHSYYAKKRIFLCYEKYGSMAQDNGFYFFRHCMEHDMERKMNRNIYFVIDKKQPDYRERLLPYKDHVIQFMSLKHMIYILSARLLISSDSKAHAYAWRDKESIIQPRINYNKKMVFLQHGVIALKQVNFQWKGPNSANLFITSNQREHDIICNYQNYPPENVVITGLARWDVLEDKGIAEKHILLMPTWRNWLEEVTDEYFAASDYYRNYMAVLNDPRTEAILEQYDLYLDFYIHPKFRDYISQFSIETNQRVKLIPFGTQPLNELMMECKMLITDYSSVCWDVYYQEKPVLFYQFDVDKYNETTGAYIDLNTELFGDQVLTPEALLEKLEEYAQNDFRLPQRYAEMRPQMYAYIDKNNSQRICDEIMKRGW